MRHPRSSDPLAALAVVAAALTLAACGDDALICNLPGHYLHHGQPGMLADFTVT